MWAHVGLMGPPCKVVHTFWTCPILQDSQEPDILQPVLQRTTNRKYDARGTRTYTRVLMAKRIAGNPIHHSSPIPNPPRWIWHNHSLQQQSWRHYRRPPWTRYMAFWFLFWRWIWRFLFQLSYFMTLRRCCSCCAYLNWNKTPTCDIWSPTPRTHTNCTKIKTICRPNGRTKPKAKCPNPSHHR